jgi:hypothetical protein
MTEIVLSHEVTERILVRLPLPAFRRRLAESAGVGYRTEAESHGPRCTANIVAALHRAFYLCHDQSSLYADATGQGSVVAAQMAAQDYMEANPNSNLKIEVIFADHQNKPDIGATSRANGSSAKAST